MFDEYSLADSQTLGTGYVVSTPHDGSVSMITHEFADQDSQTTASNINNNNKNDNGNGNNGHNYDSAWSVFGLFRKNSNQKSVSSPPQIIRKLSKKHSSKKTNQENKMDKDVFEDNVNNLYGNADFYFSNNYNTSARRPNRIMFKQLSDAKSFKQFPSFHNASSKHINISSRNDINNNNNNNNNTAGGSIFTPNNNPSTVVDFLKDKPTEMTNGRKIALRLMNNKWYYPHPDNDNKKKEDKDKDTDKKETTSSGTEQDLQIVQSGTMGSEIAVAAGVSFDERKNRNHTPIYDNINEEEEFDNVNEYGGYEKGYGHGYGYDYEYDLKERGKIVPPSLEKAWAYFEHITLPRYVYEDKNCDSYGDSNGNGGTNGATNDATNGNGKDNNKEYGKNNDNDNGNEHDDIKNSNSNIHTSCIGTQKVEFAQSGEKQFRTKLYHPFKTPLNQLGDFGLGIALYFSTLRAVMVLLVIAGLVNIPNLLYFSGSEYSNYQKSVFWALRGSSVCTEYTYVPCLDCNLDDNFADAMNRLRIITNENGEELVFALKNECDGATRRTIMTSLATTLVLTIGLALISYFLSIQEVKFDEDVQSAQDYTIVVKNPPNDAGDPKEWKDFFTKSFDNAHVTCCTVVVQNENLIEALVKRREVLHHIQKLLPPGESLKREDLEILVEDIKDERGCCSIFKGLPEYFSILLKLETKIKESIVIDKPVTSVFVTFETEHSKNQVLKAMNMEVKKAKNQENLRYSFRKSNEPLRVAEPAEPSAVRWRDFSKSRTQTMISLIFPFLATASLLVVSAFVVWALKEGFGIFPKSSIFAVMSLSISNYLYPTLAIILTNYEVHHKEGHRQISLYMKNALFKWVNTAVIFTLLTPFTSTIMGGEDDILYNVYIIFLAEIVNETTLRFLDINQNLKRHYLAPRAKTQEDMNTYMGGKEVDLSDRYTTMTKILLLTLWYCPLYPSVLFFGALALFLILISDKFCLLRGWAPSPRLGSAFSKINRNIFFPLASIVMAVMTSYMWTGFNYDNLCAVDEYEPNFIGSYVVQSFNNYEGEAIILTVSDESPMYRYCNQSLLDRIAFPAIPRFQGELKWMSSEQEKYTEIFGWVSLLIITIVTVNLAYSFGYNLTSKKKKIGNASDIPYSASGANAYIPEVKSDIISFPLIACSVNDLRNNDLFDWMSPYHNYNFYDLTLDAAEIMEEEDAEVANLAFSKMRYWDCPKI